MITEVSDLDGVVPVQKDVLRFDVSMQDPSVVDVVQGLCYAF
jgi:hypothetical protein